MKKTILIVTSLVAVGIATWLFLKPKNALKLIVPEIERIKNASVRFKKDTAYIGIDFVVKNSGFFRLNIDSLYYKVSYDTSLYIEKKIATKVALDRGEVDSVKVPVSLPYKKLISTIKNLQSEDSTKIEVKIKIVYNNIWGNATLPYEKTVSLAVPHPPRIEVLGTEFIKREGKYFLVHTAVKVSNPGKLDLRLRNTRFRIKVKDLFTAEEAYPQDIVLKPGTDKTFRVPLKLYFTNLLKTALLVLTDKDKVPYRMHVTALFSTPAMEEEAPVDLEKNGILEIRK
jgi:LEA14-like dessication related protein